MQVRLSVGWSFGCPSCTHPPHPTHPYNRPPSKEEIAARTPQVIKCDEAAREVTLSQTINGKQFGRTYHFDQVFAPDTTQERLYDASISPIVDEVLQGFNCTIFAYGQTGTGKTHTMTGEVGAVGEDGTGNALTDGSGVIPRAMAQIFTHLEENCAGTEYTVKCCFLELYNEEITDLLAPEVTGAPKVRILEDRSGVVMQGLEEPHVKTAKGIFQLLETGNARRRTAETLLNKQSSRSHSVFIVTVSVREVLAEGEEVIRVGKLYLVDLAGSENVSRSGAVDQRAKEAGNINKSLLTLGRVITALVEGQMHVPYRDSKLTRLLRDSLGGRTKTCIIATIAPTVQCQEETLSTLDYAHRAKNIKNKPELNQKISKTTHLKELASEMARLKAELVATRAKNGVFLPPEQYDEECEERKRLAARVEELEEETSTASARHEEEKAVLVASWEGRFAEVRGELDETRTKLESTRAELEAAKIKIAEREFVLDAHRSAETALAHHAVSLHSELSAAAKDIGQLFRRVDAKDALEDANLEVVKDLKAQAVERLSALEAALGAAAAEQTGRFATAHATLSEMAQRKSDASKALEDRMQTLKQEVQGLLSTAEASATALATAGSDAMEGLGKQQTEFLKIAQTAAAEASSALAEAYETVATSAAEEKQALEALLSGQTAATQAVRDTTQTIVNAVQESLAQAQAQAETAKGAVTETLTAQAAALDAMHNEFAASARKEQESIIGQLSALISGFVERAEGQVAGAAQGMKAHLAVEQRKLHAHMQGMSTTAADALGALATNASAAENAQGMAAAHVASHGAHLASAVEASASHAADLESAAHTHAAAASDALAKHGKAVATVVKKETKAMIAAAEKEVKKLAAIAQEASEAHENASKTMQAEYECDQQAMQVLEGGVQEGSAAVTAMTAAQVAGLSCLCKHITHAVDSSYTVDGQRSDVPSVRERAVPPRRQIDALKAPSEETLVQKFRETNPSGRDDFPFATNTDLMLEEGEEGEDEENVVPMDAVQRTTAVVEAEEEQQQQSEVEETVQVLSPSLVGQKRGRAPSDDTNASPSKLRAAFARGERRRATRHTPAAVTAPQE